MPSGQYNRSHLKGEKHSHWKGGKPRCVVCEKPLANYSKTRGGNSVTGACGKCRWIVKPKTNPGGYKLPATVRQRMSKSRTGEQNPAWKGGISKQPGYTTMLSGFRRARQMQSYGVHTLEQWEEIKTRYGHTCFMCQQREPEVKLTKDHIIPLLRGGDNNIGNIQPLCRSCNSKKRIKFIYYEPTYGLLVKGTNL